MHQRAGLQRVTGDTIAPLNFSIDTPPQSTCDNAPELIAARPAEARPRNLARGSVQVTKQGLTALHLSTEAYWPRKEQEARYGSQQNTTESRVRTLPVETGRSNPYCHNA